MPWRSAVRQAAGPALGGLRAYRGTALLAAATGAVALGAALPLARLATLGGVGTRLRLAVAPPLDAGFLWLHAQGPSEVREAAVALLFRLLSGVVAGLVAVALLTLLSVFVARAAARGSEIAIRRAVGASGSTLLGAQLIEGALLSGAGLLGGGAVGLLVTRLLGAWPGGLAPAAGHASLAAAAVVLGAMMLGALLPVALARRPARSTGVDPTPLALAIPAVQLGLSLTVLVTASMLRMGAAGLAPPAAARDGGGRVYEIRAAALPAAQRAARYARLLRQLETDHAVTLASLSSPGSQLGLGTVALAVGESAFFAVHHVLSADSFQAMRLKVIAGRPLTDADDWAAPRVAVVNRTLAEHLAGVGGTLVLGYGPDGRHTVVGVVDDAPRLGLGGTLLPRFVVYTSVLQHPASETQLLVRGAGGTPAAGDLGGAVRAVLGAGATVSRPVSEASLFAAEAAPLRWFARAFSAEAWAMLVAATCGTFAVMWLWVTSLFGELGLRRATGARRRDIIRFVLLRAGAVAGWGVVFGAWVGMIVWDAVYQLSETVPKWSSPAVAWSSLWLGLAAAAGALIPAWRAAKTPPATLIAAGGA